MPENPYRRLLTKISEGNKCIMLTYLDFQNHRQGTITQKMLLTGDDIMMKTFEIDDAVYEKVCLCLERGKLGIVRLEQSKAVLIEPFMPKPRLISFGGGHIAKPLSEFAAKVGFSVTVIDDRPFFANAGRFPAADKVICESFEKSFDNLNLRKSDFVVIITRGHRHDGMVLREVLKHDLSYIGMIGSKRRVNGMKEELLKEGFDKTKLDFVNAPIGLDISAITPDEIAISIVSQLISYKNKAVIDKFGKDFTQPELDVEVVRKLSEETALPKALLTILSSKGSVPRKAGAKMIAYYDGATIGSIGGGCSEAGVITKAKSLMLDKGFLIEHVDLTGDVAEAEGMVCGGVMDVLVEVF
ncbi:MAG: xanthine dehydrogenase [Clostridiales bacterium GWB2_37_7]|nr:MAG: xanthine dehydrogenase [Clostridiales bacterium GWB2_37_7]